MFEEKSDIALGHTDAAGRPFGPFLYPIGLILFWLGMACMAYAGFLFDPSIETLSGGQYGAFERINNTGLLQRQLLIFLFGAAAFVAGALLWATGSIYKLVRETAIKMLRSSIIGEVSTPSVTPESR